VVALAPAASRLGLDPQEGADFAVRPSLGGQQDDARSQRVTLAGAACPDDALEPFALTRAQDDLGGSPPSSATGLRRPSFPSAVRVHAPGPGARLPQRPGLDSTLLVLRRRLL